MILTGVVPDIDLAANNFARYQISGRITDNLEFFLKKNQELFVFAKPY